MTKYVNIATSFLDDSCARLETRLNTSVRAYETDTVWQQIVVCRGHRSSSDSSSTREGHPATKETYWGPGAREAVSFKGELLRTLGWHQGGQVCDHMLNRKGTKYGTRVKHMGPKRHWPAEDVHSGHLHDRK